MNKRSFSIIKREYGLSKLSLRYLGVLALILVIQLALLIKPIISHVPTFVANLESYRASQLFLLKSFEHIVGLTVKNSITSVVRDNLLLIHTTLSYTDAIQTYLTANVQSAKPEFAELIQKILP